MGRVVAAGNSLPDSFFVSRRHRHNRDMSIRFQKFQGRREGALRSEAMVAKKSVGLHLRSGRFRRPENYAMAQGERVPLGRTRVPPRSKAGAPGRPAVGPRKRMPLGSVHLRGSSERRTPGHAEVGQGERMPLE